MLTTMCSLNVIFGTRFALKRVKTIRKYDKHIEQQIMETFFINVI